MKSLVFLLLILANLPLLFSQGIVKSLPLAEDSELIIAELDSLYPAGMHVDTTIAVFHGREQEFFKAYKKLLTDLNEHFDNNGLSFDEPKRCFCRIYISADGNIDYYLYNLKEGVLTKEQEILFHDLLTEFVVDYKIEIESDSPYAQCAPVVFN